MSFGSKLKEEMKKQGLTNTDLAKMIGISKVSVGLYVNEKNTPSDKTLEAINKVLNTNFKTSRPKPKPREKNTNPNRISVADAAALLGITQSTLHLAIRAGTLPFAFAVKTSTQYTYHISRAGLENYLKGNVYGNENAPDGAGTPNESKNLKYQF